MAYAVAWSGKENPVARGYSFEVSVVTGVLWARLKCVVVYVAHGKGSPRPINAEGLELEVGHGAGRVLGERLVYAQPYLFPGNRSTGNQVFFDNL